MKDQGVVLYRLDIRKELISILLDGKAFELELDSEILIRMTLFYYWSENECSRI